MKDFDLLNLLFKQYLDSLSDENLALLYSDNYFYDISSEIREWANNNPDVAKLSILDEMAKRCVRKIEYISKINDNLQQLTRIIRNLSVDI